MPRRRKDKVDKNQADIVKTLRKIPGVTVETGMEDILVGHKGRNYWFEVKSEGAVSKKTGQVKQSKKQASQIKLEAEWTGHYQIVSNLQQILDRILRKNA